jgi:hypothetical protein
MQKKLIAACLTIAAFAALVIAPAASASPALTNAKGELVPVGTEIKVTAVGNAVFTGGFNITCSKVEGSGKVTANTGSSIKGEIAAANLKITGTGSGGDCTSALGNLSVTVNSKLCGETIKGTDTAVATGCGSPLTFSFAVTGVTTCRYEAASMTGTFLTGEDTQGTISEQLAKGEAGNSFFCPKEGKLDVSLAESINTGETLLIS